MFGMFVFGIMLFVLSLRKGQYKYQFSMFAWTILTCALVVSQSSTVILNIYEGIIWFILPASMVIINDSSAYIFGVLFGKTPLIEISPNKTLEGFIGGLLSTILISFYVIFMQLSRFLSNFEYLLCPQDVISFTPFAFHSCNTSDLLQESLISVFGLQLYLSNLEISSIVLAIFAGFIAPFGGFFASGVKRAFKIKDFGDSIPGHGGMTDRMDCQILMGMFTCVWIHTRLTSHDGSIQNILLQISMLSYSDQLSLFEELKKQLAIVL
jgi:phosphatidate cytidylyltransferase